MPDERRTRRSKSRTRRRKEKSITIGWIAAVVLIAAALVVLFMWKAEDRKSGTASSDVDKYGRPTTTE